MAENHRSATAAPEPITDEAVAAQLQISRQLVAEAEVTHQRAEESASEMARVLRRIAAAMERNPQSWDDLFDRRRQRP